MQQSRAGKRSVEGRVCRAARRDTKDSQGGGGGGGGGRGVESGSRSTWSEVEDRADVASAETLRSNKRARVEVCGVAVAGVRGRRVEPGSRWSGMAERIVDGGAVETSSADRGGGRTGRGRDEVTKDYGLQELVGKHRKRNFKIRVSGRVYWYIQLDKRVNGLHY
ncbi:hypothetical protein CRG98_042372 [Punica granatum]|uniref:Uncharacterized protein n=1 Tax=Punica granatum TaxID=22663 RepID=A0A2I0HZW1_PUNGR|nr:hypothetical protein CRG98_042372 [Punica granatum]